MMSPLLRHERLNRTIATFCEILAEEWRVDLEHTGSMTFMGAPCACPGTPTAEGTPPAPLTSRRHTPLGDYLDCQKW